MWDSAKAITVTPEQKKTLELWVRSPSTPQGIVLHASIILLASEGAPNNSIASRLSTSRPTVILWRERFEDEGIEALREIREGRGRKAVITGKRVEKIVNDTLYKKPGNATHWSTRSMAERQGVSHTFIRKVWDAHGLKPHLVKTFKLSNDKDFNEKLKEVVGLYMNPPENALVFSVDEKSQIQALDRTQPSLPLKTGKAGTVTHDYKRNGTTTLFAALDIMKGEVIGSCMKRHRHQEYLKFLRLIDSQVPEHLDIHIIADNYRTHKTDEVEEWLKRHPRFHCHFTPTSSSWLNLVERWFREITDKRIRRGVFGSVESLEEAIYDYIAKNNENPKPFVWTKKAEEIIEKVNRCKAVLKTLH
jgi:transposase